MTHSPLLPPGRPFFMTSQEWRDYAEREMRRSERLWMIYAVALGLSIALLFAIAWIVIGGKALW